MMNEMLPPAGSDIAGALSVLSVISDPEAARKRLAELAKAQASYNTSLDEVRRISNETQAERKLAEEAKVKAEAVNAEATSKFNQAKALSDANDLKFKALSSKEAELLSFERELQTREANMLLAHNTKTDMLKAKEVALVQRDTTLAERELAHQRRETDHAERVADLQRALQKHIK